MTLILYKNNQKYIQKQRRIFPNKQQFEKINLGLEQLCQFIFQINHKVIIVSPPTDVQKHSLRIISHDHIPIFSQPETVQVPQQVVQSQNDFYDNIVKPSIKQHCLQCKRQITKSAKIYVQKQYYCISCFANLQEYSEEYQTINKLDFPVFDHDWTAHEELLMFQGLQKHGYGNWSQIAEFINTNKNRDDVQEHFTQIYLQGNDFVENKNKIFSQRDQNGIMIIEQRQGMKRQIKRQPRITFASAMQQSRPNTTVNANTKVTTNHAQIVGFMPRRGDFEIQYDNDAQLLLAEMQFNQDDQQQEKAVKIRILDIYNHKLDERIKRKQFVISHSLLDLREHTRIDKARTREQKQLYNMMRVFARFNTPQQHQKLVQGIIKEKQLRQRIEQLKQLKKKGIRTLGEIEDQLESKKRKDDKYKKRDSDLTGDKNKRRIMRKDPNQQKPERRVLYVNKEEQDLCKKLNLTFRQYMNMKEVILREAIRNSKIQKRDITGLLRFDPKITEEVLQFLIIHEQIFQNVPNQDIIMENNDDEPLFYEDLI